MSNFAVGDKVTIYGLFKGIVKKVDSNNLLVKLKGGVLMNCHPIYTTFTVNNNG